MPAKEHSLAITDAYRARMVMLRTQVTRMVITRWSAVDPDRLDASLRRFLRDAVELLALVQFEAVRLTDGYLAAFLSSELDEAVPPQGLSPEAYAGRTSDGRSVGEVLGLGAVSLRLALLHGAPAPKALDAGMARVVRAARTEVMEAGRSALTDAMRADRRIVGYRRVTSSKPCGACLGLAGEMRASDLRLQIHASCSCTAEPVVGGVPERVTRPSGQERFDAMSIEEQDQLFAGRGGPDKAELIRSGRASLADLVTHEEHRDWPTTITETPLERLVST